MNFVPETLQRSYSLRLRATFDSFSRSRKLLCSASIVREFWKC